MRKVPSISGYVVFEHMMHSSIVDHFCNNKILTNSQHVFHKKEGYTSPNSPLPSMSLHQNDFQVDFLLLRISLSTRQVITLPHLLHLFKLEYYNINSKTITSFRTENGVLHSKVFHQR